MKNDLTCGVVRDLLPGYLEGLTGEETNCAVETHLAECPDCAALYTAMQAPAEPALTEVREVDYLKQVKRRSRRRVLAAVLCTAALFLGGIALKLFVIGEPITMSDLYWSTMEDADTVQIALYTSESAAALCGMKAERQGNTVYITGRKVLVSPLFRDGDWNTYLDRKGLAEIVLGETVVWQDGVPLSDSTLELFQAQTPYVGDAAALGNLAQLLSIRALGDYTHTLKTDALPYRWTLDFTGTHPEGMNAMRRYAPVMLALVGNLDEVAWTWRDTQDTAQTTVMSRTEVNGALAGWYGAYSLTHDVSWPAPEDIRECGTSPAALQKLRMVLRETVF